MNGTNILFIFIFFIQTTFPAQSPFLSSPEPHEQLILGFQDTSYSPDNKLSNEGVISPELPLLSPIRPESLETSYFELTELDSFTSLLANFTPEPISSISDSEESVEQCEQEPTRKPDASDLDADGSKNIFRESAKRRCNRKSERSIALLQKVLEFTYRNVRCKQCSKLCDSKRKLGEHWFEKHTNTKKADEISNGFICPEPDCGYQSKKKDTTIKHIQNRHAEFCEAKCSTCNHAFFTKERFERHAHFACTIPGCTYISHRSGDLRKHMNKISHNQNTRKRARETPSETHSPSSSDEDNDPIISFDHIYS